MNKHSPDANILPHTEELQFRFDSDVQPLLHRRKRAPAPPPPQEMKSVPEDEEEEEKEPPAAVASYRKHSPTELE
jgi:hypothetical protein